MKQVQNSNLNDPSLKLAVETAAIECYLHHVTLTENLNDAFMKINSNDQLDLKGTCLSNCNGKSLVYSFAVYQMDPVLKRWIPFTNNSYYIHNIRFLSRERKNFQKFLKNKKKMYLKPL